MSRVEVPGGWAELRERLSAAPRRLVRPVNDIRVQMTSLPLFAPVLDKLKEAGDAPVADVVQSVPQADPADIAALLALMDKLREAQVLALVQSWSFDQPISVEGLDELPQEVFDALAAEADKRSGNDDATMAEVADPTPAGDASNG